MIGITISMKSTCKRVNSFVKFLILLSWFIFFNFQFVLKSINFSSKTKFSFLFLNFLFLLLSDQILNLLSLISNQPIKFIDLTNQSFDLILLIISELRCIFFL